MSKGRRFRSSSPETHVSEPLSELAEKLDLRPASELPARTPLPPPEPVLGPLHAARRRKAETAELDEQPADSHAAREDARRPRFAPVPTGFMNVSQDAAAGIKVNKRLWTDADGNARSTAALQFAEDKKLSRQAESAMVQAVEDLGFTYRSNRRQWERDSDPATQTPGENVIEATVVAKALAEGRGVAGRGR